MKEFIKKSIKNEDRGIYSFISKNYQNEINNLGVTLFIKWLAEELNIEASSINRGALNSAMFRKRSKAGNSKSYSEINMPSNSHPDNISTESDFKFSSPDDLPEKSRKNVY